MERMLHIHERIAAGRWPNCRTLAHELEVATKTVMRDLEFMRDRLQLPLEYDEIRHGYHYTSEVSQFPTVTISEGELVALLVARKAIEQYRGSAFEAPLAAAFSKLVAQLPQNVSLHLGDARAAISFRPFGPAVSDLEQFRRISAAVLRSVELEFRYRKLSDDAAEPRRLRPYHLACVNNQWYLIGHDPDRNALRTFVVPRMSQVRATKRAFVRPADFSLENYLGGSFGIMAGEGNHRVRVRFDAVGSRLVRERFWHASQTLSERRDGTVELTLQLSSLEEVERWILGWGEHAEVLAPLGLRRRIHQVATGIAARHCSN
jgi:predicted DNA-binding transcriptional regulator YafY